MKKEMNFDSLTTPPEHESRCDMFVDHVSEIIAPKYPELGFDPENITNTAIPPTPKWIEEIAKKVAFKGDEKRWKKYLDFNTRMNRIYDEEGLSENTAGVQIWGWGGERAIPQLEEAVDEVIETARGYRGEFLRDEIEGPLIDNDPDLPSSYLRFLFK